MTNQYPIVGSNNDIPEPILPFMPRSVILTGDSLTSRGNYNTAPTTFTTTNGVTRVVGTSLAAFVGASVTIVNATEASLNGVWTVAGVTTSSDFTINTPLVPNGVAAGSPQLINNHGSRDLNFFEIGNAVLGHPFNVLYNTGKPGKTLSYIASYFQQDVLDHNPTLVQIQGGINDVNTIKTAAGTGATVLAAMKVSMEEMISAAIAAGVIPLVHTICPFNAAYANYTAEGQQVINLFNGWLRELAYFDMRKAFLVDAYAICVDPTSATGDYTAGLTSDDVHPNAKACQLIGNEIASVLGNLYYTPRMWGVSLSDSYTTSSTNPNVVVNPLFITNSGGTASGTGNSGTVAALHTATWTQAGAGTCVCSVASRADGFGNDQVFTMNPTTTGEQISILTNAMSARVSTGDIMVLEGNLQMSALANISNILFCIDWTANGITATQPCAMITGSASGPAADINWVLRTKPVALPASVTAFRWRLTIAFSGAATNCIAKIGRVSLRKIAAITDANTN
jgi:lysophospholipase L1-like esterase